MNTMGAAREIIVRRNTILLSPQEWMLSNESLISPIRREQLRCTWGHSDLGREKKDILNLIASLALNSYKSTYAVEALHDPIQGTVANRALLNIYRPYLEMAHPRWESWLSGNPGAEGEREWTEYRLAMGEGISRLITDLLPLEVIPTGKFILPWMDMRTPPLFPFASPVLNPETMLRSSIQAVEYIALKGLLLNFHSTFFLHVISEIESYGMEWSQRKMKESTSDEDLALYRSLLDHYSLQQLRQLQFFSAAILEKDDLLKGSLLHHVASFTWDNLLALADLTEEYNLEWALAAHEWSE